MPGDADATKQRLISAATAEFAAHGLAGARVDRIAATAGANKAQIYHYFGSKDELFDSYERQPDMRRIATWRRLERGAPYPPLEPLVENNRTDIATIARAQKAGHVPEHFTAVELLTLVLTLAAMWASQTPELTEVLRRHSLARRRAVVVEAVRAILAL